MFTFSPSVFFNLIFGNVSFVVPMKEGVERVDLVICKVTCQCFMPRKNDD